MNMTHFQLHDFVGGVHPDENKEQSTQAPIAQAGLPEKLVLPIGQHIGAQSIPVVNQGDQVLKGQLIAEAEGFVSANLHAPTSGTISAIEDRTLAHPSGMSGLCIEITPDGKDQWIEHSGLDNYLELPAHELISCIQQAGITGLGGAGFPTHVKASANAEKIETLIINAAECEPYITADDMLMQERAEEIVLGIEILQHILQPESVLIGVEDNKPKAIEALNHFLKVSRDDTHNIHVIEIPTKYPSGGEKQLIQILTGKEVPTGGIPADIGIVCQNVGTAYSIYQAVAKGEPLISRITTVTGNACAQPQNYEVLIGTPVEHLLKISNSDLNKTSRLVMGGPMMGFTLEKVTTPIIKASNCIIAATNEELPDPAMEQACIRCGMCTEACPAQLLPQQLYWFSKSSNLEQAETHNIADCIECGACSFVCPSNIPLVQYYRHTKGEIKQANADKVKSDRAKERFEARVARQEREAAEKEAKRKARAEAAAKKQAQKKEEQKAAEAAGTAPSAPAGKAAPTPAADLETLQKKLEAAKTAVAKSKEKLAAAEAEGSDKVELFKGALEKAQTKMKDAAKAIAEAKKAEKAAQASTDKGDPNSPDRLKNKLELAEARLETAKKRLEEAKAEGSDKVDAFQTALDKQTERVKEAKSAYEDAVKAESSTSGATSNDAPDVDALAKKVLAAQTRVDKAQERLNMAKEQGLDTVDALQLGLDKQLQKLQDAQNALNEAKAGAAQ
jgi:electron transport complex protein RnfC